MLVVHKVASDSKEPGACPDEEITNKEAVESDQNYCMTRIFMTR